MYKQYLKPFSESLMMLTKLFDVGWILQSNLPKISVIFRVLSTIVTNKR